MAKLRLPDWRDPRTRARLIVWLLTLSIVVVAFSVSAIALTSRKQFCSLCHEMDQDLVAFEKSTHASISCYGCHMPAGAHPGIFMLHKVEALKELYLHFTNSYEKPINGHNHYALAKIGSAECKQCHAPLNRSFTPGPGIIIDHKVHDEKKIACPLCHNRVAHPDMEGYEDWMAMEACFRCHTQEPKGKGEKKAEDEDHASGDAPSGGGIVGVAHASGGASEAEIARKFDFVAPGECAACHPKSFELKPADHREKGWMPKGHHRAYKKVEEAEEGEAEEPKEARGPALMARAWASSESEKPAPSGEAAPGAEAEKKEEKISKPCNVCHAKKFCVDCHGMEEIPHPDTFKEEHKKLVAKGTKACENCHGGPGFCNNCHHNDVPTIKAWLAPPGHPKYVRDKGAEGCFKCHDPRLCETCHIRGKSDRKYL